MPESIRPSSRPATSRTRCCFANVFVRAIDAPDTNLSSLAERLRWHRESCQSYRDGKVSPAFDKILEAAPRMPREMRMDLLNEVARACGISIVFSLDRERPDAMADGEAYRDNVRAAEHSLQDLRDEADLALVDKHIDPAERERLERKTAEHLANVASLSGPNSPRPIRAGFTDDHIVILVLIGVVLLAIAGSLISHAIDDAGRRAAPKPPPATAPADNRPRFLDAVGIRKSWPEPTPRWARECLA